MDHFQYGFFDELTKLADDLQYLRDIGYGGYTAAPQSPVMGKVNQLRSSWNSFTNAAKSAVVPAIAGGAATAGANLAFGATPSAALTSAGIGATSAGIGRTLKPAAQVVRDTASLGAAGVQQAANQAGQAIKARFQGGVRGAQANTATATNPVSRAVGATTGFARGFFKGGAFRRHLLRKLAAMQNAGEAMSSIKKRLYNPIKSGMLGYHVTKKHFNKIRQANPNMPTSSVRDTAYRSSSDYMDKLRKRFPF